MKCESCNIREIESEEPADEGQNPYRLCIPCRDRLLNLALRPLEFFNLTAIHGHSFYLHDDFYDYDTGEATQPEIEVVNPNKFPFPDFEQIKNDIHSIIDFSLVQYFTDDFVISQLKQLDNLEVLKRIEEKVKYNRAINYKAYEIVGKVIGRTAEEWIKKEWTNRQENELQIFAEPIVNCLDFSEAFKVITQELENGDDKFLSENVSALLFLLPRKLSMKVMKALRVEFDIDNPENIGYVFTMPLSHVAGLNTEELHHFEDDIKTLI